MQRSKSRRRSAARIMGWTLVAVAYAAALVWAADISAVDGATASAAAQPVAAAAGDASEMMGKALIAVEAPVHEAPLVTLGIAVGLVVLGGAWYIVHAVRTRHPRYRRARLVLRHITTLL